MQTFNGGAMINTFQPYTAERDTYVYYNQTITTIRSVIHDGHRRRRCTRTEFIGWIRSWTGSSAVYNPGINAFADHCVAAAMLPLH